MDFLVTVRFFVQRTKDEKTKRRKDKMNPPCQGIDKQEHDYHP